MSPHRPQGAVRNYPFNCWWAAAATDEVSRKPLSRWLLEQRVVLFRTAAGDPVALADRCAHRWAPYNGELKCAITCSCRRTSWT